MAGASALAQHIFAGSGVLVVVSELVFAAVFLFAFSGSTNEPFTCFGRRKMYGIEHKKAPGTAGTVPGVG